MVSIRDDLIDSQQATEENPGPLLSKEGRPFSPNSTNSHLLLETANKTRPTGQILASPSIKTAEEGTAKVPCSSAPLKESIGHTEVEVIAGASLGFLVSIAVYTILWYRIPYLFFNSLL